MKKIISCFFIVLLTTAYSCAVTSAAASGGSTVSDDEVHLSSTVTNIPQQPQNPLRDLQAVALVVEIPDDLQRAGIDPDVLRKDAEFDLRMSGLRILTEEQLQFTEGRPLFSLNLVNVTLGNYEQFIINIEAGLYEQAVLIRRDMMQRQAGVVDGLTWFMQDLDLYDQFQLYTHLRQRVKEIVGMFVSEYRNAR